MGSPATGQIGIVLEPTATPGEQLLMAYTAVAASMSLTTQPPWSTGGRLIVRVQGNSATGTIQIAGKNPAGGNISETLSTVPIFPANAQSSEVGAFEYVTVNAFASVNASGITTTGLTGGNIQIKAVPVAKYLVPGTIKEKAEYTMHKPKEFRGLPSAVTQDIQLEKKVTLDELLIDLYPETSMFFPYMTCGASPTVTTNPGTPTVLLASTAVSGSPLSLTTQPVWPGQKLKFVVTSAGASGSIVVSGKDVNNQNQSETVSMSGNGTFYSQYVYSSVNASGLVCSGLTGGSVAISGINAWIYTWVPDSSLNLYSATVEWFTGTVSKSLPWTAFSEVVLSMAANKEWTISCKGICQDDLPIGDRTTTNLVANRVASLSQPLDVPEGGWQTMVYIDPDPGTFPSSAYAQLMDAKITFSIPNEGIWTAANTQLYSQVGRAQITTTVEATIDMTDLVQKEAWRKNAKQYVTFVVTGGIVAAGTYKSMQMTFPVYYDQFDVEAAPDAKFVTGKLKFQCAYDSVLGGEYQIVITNTQSPTYTA